MQSSTLPLTSSSGNHDGCTILWPGTKLRQIKDRRKLCWHTNGTSSPLLLLCVCLSWGAMHFPISFMYSFISTATTEHASFPPSQCANNNNKKAQQHSSRSMVVPQYPESGIRFCINWDKKTILSIYESEVPPCPLGRPI